MREAVQAYTQAGGDDFPAQPICLCALGELYIQGKPTNLSRITPQRAQAYQTDHQISCKDIGIPFRATQ